MTLAATDHPVHELIAKRWSPNEFADKAVPPEVLASLFEAARWAPSSFNEQPWRFLIATKQQPEEFEKMLSVLVDQNQVWARNAPVLALGIASLSFARNGRANKAALHDLGQAAANLTLEATARGLYVHQMAGILPARARELYAIPEGFEILTGLAIGYLAESANAPKTRTRKPIGEIVFSGVWGQAAQVGS